ncbi:ADP-ribosylation factor-like protein 13B [Ceratitis capitata]|uniref:ADP-ribosylation factor-like protein 13B n=1 Tax=Ceratitis capitata TaxID=7213 RepID=UPI000329A560|nr:ADP-ribosylation factor-like protein 13B [Ceratitis capitata]
MGAVLHKLCSCCRKKRNSIGTLPDRRIKVLLLGVMASGKTELGYILSRQQRENFEPTNGVQFYRIELPERYVSITEVGGNTEIQKIWHHYFLTTMGIIYCFDMSTSYEKLRDSFDCLRRALMHPYVRGKPVLLVATKADLADEGIQLFDIENTFQLEALAKYYLSSAHVCYVGKNICMDNLWNGFGWFVKYIIDNMDQLQMRLKTDANLEAWQDQIKKLVSEGRMKRGRYRQFQYHLKNTSRRKLWYRSFGHFRTKRIRPHTAPATINAAAFGTNTSTTEPENSPSEACVTVASKVPNLSANSLEVGKVSQA